MLDALRTTVYARISPERLSLRDVRSGQSIDEVPKLAVARDASGRQTILAVGSEAQLAASLRGGEVLAPFGHPRSIVSDFTVGEVLLRHQLRRLLAGRLPRPWLRLVMHPLGRPEGGYTQVELHALEQMARTAGASRVEVWCGADLTDEQLRAPRLDAGPRRPG